MFGTRRGTKTWQHNLLKSFESICKTLGISGPRLSWHTLRHSMATAYIRSHGDVFRLQQLLGHSNITTTRRYVHLASQDLTRDHQQHSLFSAASR